MKGLKNKFRSYLPILLLAGCCLLSFGFHDIQMAKFRMVEEENGYSFHLSFDRKDILEAVYAASAYEEDVLSQISKYVKAHLTYTIDGADVKYSMDDIEYTNDNILLKGEFEHFNGTIKKIRVENTCLINHVPGQLNIMEFYIKEKKRFFRLSADRIATVVEY